jgi:hypothetical protein
MGKTPNRSGNLRIAVTFSLFPENSCGMRGPERKAAADTGLPPFMNWIRVT